MGGPCGLPILTLFTWRESAGKRSSLVHLYQSRACATSLM